MKHLVFVVFLQCIFCNARAADLVNGYIIKANGDTVKCKIKLGGVPRATGGDQVTVVNQDGESIRYKAKEGEVIGYGVYLAGRSADFRYFELKPKAESNFYQLLYNGSKYKLYYIIETADMGTVVTSSPKYVFVNEKGAFNFFGTCTICGWRKRLGELLQDDAAALVELEKISAKDIPDFVGRIDKM